MWLFGPYTAAPSYFGGICKDKVKKHKPSDDIHVHVNDIYQVYLQVQAELMELECQFFLSDYYFCCLGNPHNTDIFYSLIILWGPIALTEMKQTVCIYFTYHT